MNFSKTRNTNVDKKSTHGPKIEETFDRGLSIGNDPETDPAYFTFFPPQDDGPKSSAITSQQSPINLYQRK